MVFTSNHPVGALGLALQIWGNLSSSSDGPQGHGSLTADPLQLLQSHRTSEAGKEPQDHPVQPLSNAHLVSSPSATRTQRSLGTSLGSPCPCSHPSRAQILPVPSLSSQHSLRPCPLSCPLVLTPLATASVKQKYQQQLENPGPSAGV